MIITVKAGDLRGGDVFRKKTGTFGYIVISESSARFLGLDAEKVHGIGANGNTTSVSRDTDVVRTTLEATHTAPLKPGDDGAVGIGEEPNPPHLGVGDDLEHDLNDCLERFRFGPNAEDTRRELSTALAAVLARYVAEGRIPAEIEAEATRVRLRQDPLNPDALTVELHDTLRYWLTTGRVPRSKLMGGRVAVPAPESAEEPQAARAAAAAELLTALKSVTHFGPVTIERRGDRFTVVYSNGKTGDEKLEIAGYAEDLPTAARRYLDALLEHTNTA